jgi:phospholipid N-methyltransferase
VERLFQAPGAAFAFAAAVVRNPRGVGAVAPASRWLAEAIGRELDGCACDTLVEVGPGTGAITRVIDARRQAFARVLAVERDAWMVSVLRERFPEMEIVHGCATELARHVRAASPVAIVSSLPFRSLPEEVAAGCVRALAETLDGSPGSMLLQYTYGLGSPPFSSPGPRFAWSRVGLVARNLPPATIWRLDRLRTSEDALPAT